MAAPIQRVYAADHLWETPDDGIRYEILAGRLTVNPPPSEVHQRISTKLSAFVTTHVLQHDLGAVYHAPTGVKLDDRTAVEPDLVFVERGRVEIVTDRGIEGSPDLVVEILSRGTRSRDLTEKLRLYEKARVPHYWTLDPVAIRLDARELRDGRYVVVASHGAGEIFEPSLFPGLRLSIDELWKPW